MLLDKVFGWCRVLVGYEAVDRTIVIDLHGHKFTTVITYYVKSYEWDYCLLYWKQKTSELIKGQVLSLLLLFYTAGFVHKWHGLHWNRYSKVVRH